MGSYGVNGTAVHDDNAVSILYRSSTLRNDDLGGFWNILTECLTDQCIGTGIDSAGRVVQNEDLWLFKQGAGDTQTLFLTTRNVGTTLFDIGVVSPWELIDKFIRLCQFAGFDHFFIGSIFIAPAQIVFDGAGEQNVFLKNNGNLVTQCFQIIVANIDTADTDSTFGAVVQTGDQLDLDEPVPPMIPMVSPERICRLMLDSAIRSAF